MQLTPTDHRPDPADPIHALTWDLETALDTLWDLEVRSWGYGPDSLIGGSVLGRPFLVEVEGDPDGNIYTTRFLSSSESFSLRDVEDAAEALWASVAD